ncbi:MAG: phosphodiesterase [Clostridiales bacterium]|nr:phosphodiesterase [Clostridiales bacterium]
MKLLIASDIHGSAYFCEKLAERISIETPDRVVLLGDLLYHGPRNDLPRGYSPKDVARRLNELKSIIIAVRGNCEAEVDSMMLDFPITADYAVIFADGITMFATHGHIYTEEKPLPHAKGDVFLMGHTHVPACREHDDYFYLNPGSVSIPKENSPHGYMIYDGGNFVWMTLDGEEYMRKEFSVK